MVTRSKQPPYPIKNPLKVGEQTVENIARMKNIDNFASVKVALSLESLNKAVKIFRNPQRGGRRPQISVGSVVYRLSGSPKDLTSTMVASPRQGQTSRLITLIHDRGTLANEAVMLSSISLLNSFRRAFTDLLPGKEPKLYYTVTSFDAIDLVRVSQFSVGGRGLTYFLLTYFLPCSYSLQYFTLTFTQWMQKKIHLITGNHS